jgi:hypothetical protein
MSFLDKYRPVPAPKMKRGPAHTFGWMRRSDMDKDGEFVWERPNGTFYVHPNKDEPILVQTVMLKGK